MFPILIYQIWLKKYYKYVFPYKFIGRGAAPGIFDQLVLCNISVPRQVAYMQRTKKACRLHSADNRSLLLTPKLQGFFGAHHTSFGQRRGQQ